MGALILSAIGAAYIPAIADKPLHAQLSGALCAIVAVLAAVGIFLPRISGPKMAVRYEVGGAIVESGDNKYMVLPSGITFDQSGQIAASRYTDIALRWQVVSFFRSRPKALPVMLIFTAALSMLLIWAEAANPGSNPYAEQAIWAFPMLTKAAVMLANCILLLLAVLSIVAMFGVPVVREIAHEIRQQAAIKPGVALLESGENLEGLAAPYKMVCTRRGEIPYDFLSRVEQTRKQNADNYVVAVPMGTDIVAIACPAATDSPTATEISETRTTFVPSAPTGEGESFEVYAVFVREFAPNVRKWITGHQARTDGAFAALSAAMRVSCLLLAFCVSAFAQPKSVQVAAYMGDRHMVASQGVDVLFAFQEGTLRRTGDGAKTVQQLLPDGLAFSDNDNAGLLKEIFIGGSKIPPAARPTAQASAEPVSAIPIEKIKPSKSFLESTDSLALRGYEASIRAGVRKLAMEVYPRWNFIFFLFKFILVPVLVGLSFLAYFIAKSAFKEMQSSGNIDVLSRPLVFWGYKGRNCVWLCAIFVGIMLILDGFVSDAVNGNSFWEWLVKSAVKMFALYHITIWITPDPPKAKVMSSPAHASHNYQLTEGR